MKVIQVWVGSEIPTHIVRCMKSLERFTRSKGIEHIVYTDHKCEKFSYIKQCEVPTDILEVVEKFEFKYMATKVDLMRYLMLSKVDEYTFYIDSDCYFIKDPFDLLVESNKDWFSRESIRSEYINNGVIGITPNSEIMKSIVDVCLRELESSSNKATTFLKIGPKFINSIVSGFLDEFYVRNEPTWMYSATYQSHFRSYKDENEDAKIIKKALSGGSYGTHFFKPHGTPNDVACKVVNRIIDKLEEMVK